MALSIYNGVAFIPVGSNVLIAPLASVEVRRESDNALAALYSNEAGTAALANPFTADASARVSFCAAGRAGGYKVKVSKDGNEVELRHVAIGRAAQFDISDTMGLTLQAETIADFNDALGLGPASTPSFAQVLLGGDPTNALHAVTRQYVDTLQSGLDAKPSVHAASTGNVNLNAPGTTLDAVTMVSGRRYLIKDQSAPQQNGIYLFNGSAAAMTRASDMDAWAEVPGAFTYVEEGTANAESGWLCTADQGGTLDTTAMTWSKFWGPNTFQPLDATLTTMAALATVSDRGIYFTATDVAALFTLTSFGRSLVDDADATAARSTLGLVIGTDVQAFDTDLNAIAALVSAANQLPYATGAGTWALTTLSAFARTLIDDADAATARQTLGIEEAIIFAASDETTAIVTGTNKVKFRMPYAFTLTGVRASLSTAQATGVIFTVDINEAGVSILSTKLTIDNTELTSFTAATAAVLSDTSLANDAEISVDVDQVGDGTAKGLKVMLIGRKT